MNRRHQRRQVHPAPLLAGVFLIFMGIAEIWMGVDQRWTDDVEGTRCLLGAAVLCLGLWGVRDGLRDRFQHKPPVKDGLTRQYIFQDVDGRQSSHVDGVLLRSQLECLRQRGPGASFSLKILPAPEVKGLGWLERMDCACSNSLRLRAHFVDNQDGICTVRKKDVDTPEAEAILTRLLAGLADLSGWELEETAAKPGEGRTVQLLAITDGIGTDRFPFFTERDLELAVEGLASGEYEQAELYLPCCTLFLFPAEPEEDGEDRIFLKLAAGEEARSTAGYFWTDTVEQATARAVQILRLGLVNDLDGIHVLGRSIKGGSNEKVF